MALPDLDDLRTQVANQAASLAEGVNDGFSDFHMGAGDYVVELRVPDGPSTGGGKQARQHLRLVPRRQGYPIVLVGTVDPVTSTAELRTFEHVAVLHELRFRRPIEITPNEYAAFLQKAELVLSLARVRGAQVPAPPALLEQRRKMGRISLATALVFVVVMILAALVVFRVALKLRGG